MTYDIVPTICLSLVAVFIVQGVTIYAVVKAVVLGRALVERQSDTEPDRKVAGPWSTR